MIDVPARVKDALRSGEYKKEYLMKVYRYVDDYESVISMYFERQTGTNNFVDTGHLDMCITEAGEEYRLYFKRWTGVKYGFSRIDLAWDYHGQHYSRTFYSQTYEDYSYVDFVAPTIIRSATATVYDTTIPQNFNNADLEIQHKYKHYREEITLDNTRLVDESVKFDERMCSSTDLKFGLCEGTSLEFQYFNHANINGCRIESKLKVQYKDENGILSWHQIPMGWFDVDSCSRQASTGIIKVTAYNKLKSEYLDSVQPVKDIIEAGEYGTPGEVSIHTLLKALLADYSTEETPSYIRTLDNSTYVVPSSFSFQGGTVYKEYGGSGNYIRLWTTTVFFSLPEQSRNDIYRYIVNATGIYSAIKSRYNYDGLYIGTSENHHSLTWLAERYGAVDASGKAVIKNTNGVELKSFYPFASYLVNPTSEFVSDNTGIYLTFCVGVDELEYDTDPVGNLSTEQKVQNALYILNNINVCTIQENVIPELEKVKVTTNDIQSGVSLRELQSATFELDCKYGKLDRVTDMFSGISLNNGGLYPADNLYPANNLYPRGTAEAGFKSMYSKLWADEGNVRSFRYLIITYKGTETEGGQTREVEKKLQRTVNANGTDDYNMSSNWLFKNLVWSDADVGSYADDMVTKLRNIKWFPFEMWCAGLPYVEAGDEIEIQMQEGTYKSYVLRRTLKGIQDLQDEMINGTLDIF